MKNILILLVLALFAREASAVEAGTPAPDFTLKSTKGENLRLKEYRGKVVLLNFWASWCGPCRQEMPVLERIRSRYEPLGVVVLGVNVDSDEGKALAIAKDAGVNFPLLLDTGQGVSEAYDVSAMPFTVLVDRDGNVSWIHKGYNAGDEVHYVDRLKSLIRTPASAD
ncbi:MAG: TlpA family protein disulfide reductase [Pseudomonadales bacterium]|nr:TlpA family protein disulfide reductase [Pseudomonadales bacterium]